MSKQNHSLHHLNCNKCFFVLTNYSYPFCKGCNPLPTRWPPVPLGSDYLVMVTAKNRLDAGNQRYKCIYELAFDRHKRVREAEEEVLNPAKKQEYDFSGQTTKVTVTTTVKPGEIEDEGS